MRLLMICVLAFSGWAAAAPEHSSNKNNENDPSEELRQEAQGDNLAPVLNVLSRRKRGSAKSNLPYSNYRPSGGMHRYRYPLYRKRSNRPQIPLNYEDEVILPGAEGDYSDYQDQMLRGPSLFRERDQQQDRKKKEMLLEDDGYFTDDYIPEKKVPLIPFALPLKKKDSIYNLANSPYDLRTIGHMYEMGKRDDITEPNNLDEMSQFHSVGRKSPPRVLSPSEQFYDAIDSIKRKKAIFDDRINHLSEAERMEHLIKLKNFLSSAAVNRMNNDGDMSLRDPMIRRKRDTVAVSPVKGVTKVNSTSTSPKAHIRDSSLTVPARYRQTQLPADRRKRAFNDYYNWERKALESEYQEPVEKRRNTDKDLNDFLTREYFKSIARSVGQKKKRMAYAQFEANKRSSGLDQFLENPAMLQYMQSKLKEAEEEVALEAENEIGRGNTEELLSNIVVRLDALERMREALARLEELQTEEKTKAQKSTSSGLRTGGVKKRESSIKRSEAETSASESRSDDTDKKKKRKRSSLDARKIRRMRRGDEAQLAALFLGNSREECPVLDRVVMNCMGVSEAAGDHDQVFLQPCIRHEICYMCGSGMSVSGHECDAILSSSLEAACSGNLDCLSAAGTTFDLLSDAARYDEGNTCTHDPCLRQYLESR